MDPLHSTFMRPHTDWTVLVLNAPAQNQEVASSSGKAEDNWDCVKIHFCGLGDGTLTEMEAAGPGSVLYLILLR